MNIKNKYSIIIPVYNSENSLNELYERTCKVFEKNLKNVEFIFVNDYSHDNSFNILKQIQSQNNQVKIISLIKNFGQHNATLCGFHYANGDYVIIMDDDLQHPPEEIPKLINKINDGYDVVYGKYIQKQHSKKENFFSHIFEKIMHVALKIPDKIYISSFAIFSSEVIQNACLFKGSYVFLPAIISENVSMDKVTNVAVLHNQRNHGSSNYSPIRYLKLSLNLIINHSVLPLTLISALGISISTISFIYGIYIILQNVFDPTFGLVGWSSLMVAITFLSGMILFSLGVVGEYLRRVLVEVSYGKQYVIGEMYF